LAIPSSILCHQGAGAGAGAGGADVPTESLGNCKNMVEPFQPIKAMEEE